VRGKRSTSKNAGSPSCSYTRRHKLLARDWRYRTLGRRTTFYFWTVYVLLLLAVLYLTPENWRFVEGALFGMTAVAFWLLPVALMPDHIARWERGARDILARRSQRCLARRGSDSNAPTAASE
jgi:hypothetical protein